MRTPRLRTIKLRRWECLDEEQQNNIKNKILNWVLRVACCSLDTSARPKMMTATIQESGTCIIMNRFNCDYTKQAVAFIYEKIPRVSMDRRTYRQTDKYSQTFSAAGQTYNITRHSGKQSISDRKIDEQKSGLPYVMVDQVVFTIVDH